MTKTVITGATGFLGKHLMRQLPSACGLGSRDYDLRQPAQVEALFKHYGKIDTLYHLAAHVGGIGANRLHPGEFFYDNMTMGLNIIHAAYRHRVGKVVFIGTTCSYPKLCSTPFREGALFDGYPEETNAPYGIAKRALLAMLQAYWLEYKLDFCYLIPTNLYGPGDNFDDNTSHVIPALIKKFYQAKIDNAPEVEVWGSGNATRDFLFVEDAAEAIALAGENYTSDRPLNLGSGQEIRIDVLAYHIKEIIGCNSRIIYNKQMPDGQPRRCLDSVEAEYQLGWKASTRLKDGLAKTIEWYMENCLEAA